MNALRRLIAVVVEVRPDERATTILMFMYSFLAMTTYNIVQPVTRSAFIADFGAGNIPYILLAAGPAVGLLMHAYGRLDATLPKQWALPLLQIGLAAVLAAFWLLFQTGSRWVSAGFYLFGLLLGTLLVSQFWTLAHEIYDPRQARRLFGFIGAGFGLGGMAGAGLVIAGPAGRDALLLFSAGSLLATTGLAVAIARRERRVHDPAVDAENTPTPGVIAALRLVGASPSLRQIAALIGLAALGGVVVDQQLNMAAEQFRGGDEAAVTSFLASVRLVVSASQFVLQIAFVKQIYRLLGLGFALLMLPVGLAATALPILVSGALLAPAVATVVDRSIRYSVDRTTREMLFLPVPSSLKRRAKPFLDVTVDRLARGTGAVLMLVLIQPWGLGLGWPQLSIVVLVMVGAWLVLAARAKDRYVLAIRDGLESQAVDVRAVDVADLTTVEALLEELAHPEERRVLHAITVLESLDKQHLVTPLLLHHTAPAVRARALTMLGGSRPEVVRRWEPMVTRLVNDSDADVRAHAIVQLARIRGEDAASLAHSLLAAHSPRAAVSAAVVLASTGRAEDAAVAETTLTTLTADGSDAAALVRRDVAAAIRQLDNRNCRQLLIPLLQDTDPRVAEEAMRSVRAFRPFDPLYVPTLTSLLGDRRLKGGARDVLVAYGEPVVEFLGYALGDLDEDVWVRRHVPATLARIPVQQSMDLLVAHLDDQDGFLRYKVVAAMNHLHRVGPELAFSNDRVEAVVLTETRRFFTHITLRQALVDAEPVYGDTLLSRVLGEKTARAVDRVYRLLALLHPWRDIESVRWTIERNASARGQAFEYLDNVLSQRVRRVVLPMLEDLPGPERARRGHQLLGTRARDLEETLLALINDGDEIVAAAAIDLVGEQRLWNLADDVEHVLAHRPVDDWQVFQAASWTLASRRLTESERRERWRESLPAIVLADRLGGLSLFRWVEVDEICRLARSGRQARHGPGDTLLAEGQVPDALHVLLDGTLTASTRAGRSRQLAAPALVGVAPALVGRRSRETVRAHGHAITLAIPRDELLTVLAGSTGLVQGLFRAMAESMPSVRVPRALRGTAPKQVAGFPGEISAVQRVLALQQVPLFAHVSADGLLQLGALTRVEPFDGGDLLSRTAETPLRVILRGTLTVERPSTDDPARHAGPGDTIGVYEVLAGVPRATGADHVVATETGAALRLNRDELFDLLGQRPALLEQLFAAIATPEG